MPSLCKILVSWIHVPHMTFEGHLAHAHASAPALNLTTRAFSFVFDRYGAAKTTSPAVRLIGGAPARRKA